MSRHKKKHEINRWTPLVVMGSVFFAVVIMSVGFLVFGEKAPSSIADISLGDNYLSELEYVQAIAEYKVELELEPKNSEAKEQLVQTYEEWASYAISEGDYKRAEQILRLGMSDTHSPDFIWEIAKTSLKGLGFDRALDLGKDMFGL